MTISALTTTNLQINTTRRMWHAHLPGRVVFGNGYTRPVQVVGDKVLYTGIKKCNPTELTLQAVPDGKLTGTVNYAFVMYRESTKERSLSHVVMAGLVCNNSKVNSVANQGVPFIPDTEKDVSHLEVYLNVEEVGGWYRAGKFAIPQLGYGFGVAIDISVDDLVTKRPLEDQLQTSIYPAVDSAAFWNGALYGGRLPGRKIATATGTTITFTKDSDTITISNGTFWESDRYKSLVKDDEIICFIYEPSSDGASAKIKLPGSISETSDPWDGSTATYDVVDDNIQIGSEEQTIYVSSTYIGEEGNGITRGWITWNPLNQLRDEYQASVGARITALGHDRENLAVFFDKAIVVYSGDPGLDVPTPRSVTVSNSIGSLAQHHVWNTRDGALWWITRNRVFTLSGSEVVDVTASWGNASIFEKHFEAEDASNFYNWTVTYNPTTNQSMVVNMAEPDAADNTDTRAEKFGRVALLIDHTRQAFYKLEFPVRLKTVCCIPRQDGTWSWFCCAASATQPGVDSGDPVTSYFCTLFRDGNADNVESVTPILWNAAAAMRRSGGHSIPVGERLLVDADFTQADATVVYKSSVVAERSLIHGAGSEIHSRDVTIGDIKTKDWIIYRRSKDGMGMQRKWSGQVDASHDRVKLLSAMILDDMVPLRGFDE